MQTEFESQKFQMLKPILKPQANAERLHGNMQAHADKIFKLDVNNLKIFTEMKSRTVDVQEQIKAIKFAPRDPQFDHIQRSQLYNLEELDKDNVKQRQQLTADIKRIEKSLNENFNKIQEFIRMKSEARESLKHLNHKKFNQIEEQFEDLHKRSTDLCMNLSSNRWRQLHT